MFMYICIEEEEEERHEGISNEPTNQPIHTLTHIITHHPFLSLPSPVVYITHILSHPS